MARRLKYILCDRTSNFMEWEAEGDSQLLEYLNKLL